MEIFTHSEKIRFEHCDPAGIVFYPRYFEMLNRVIEDWFDIRLGHNFVEIHDVMQCAVPTVHIDIDFIALSRHGDILQFYLTPLRLGNASLALSISGHCGVQKRLSMTTKLVFLDKKTAKSAPWPADIRKEILNEITISERADA
ncbi:MAG: thioesterase family protein [Paracoccaceae bacterium]